MPAEISLEGRRGNRKNQAKLCSELLSPAELDFYSGCGSSTWKTHGEIHIYCTIHSRHLNYGRKTLSVNLHQRDPKAKSNLRKFTVKRKCFSCLLILFCWWQVIQTITAVDKDDFANGKGFSFSFPGGVPANPNFTLKDNEGMDGGYKKHINSFIYIFYSQEKLEFPK